jgi:hypothetical protein
MIDPLETSSADEKPEGPEGEQLISDARMAEADTRYFERRAKAREIMLKNINRVVPREPGEKHPFAEYEEVESP